MGSRGSSGCVYWLGEWAGLHLPESGLLFIKCKPYTHVLKLLEWVRLSPHMRAGVSFCLECFPELSFPTNRFCPGSCLKPPRPPALASHPCASPDTDVHPKASSRACSPHLAHSLGSSRTETISLSSAPPERGEWGAIQECWLINPWGGQGCVQFTTAN